jgi:hypothetical protein
VDRLNAAVEALAVTVTGKDKVVTMWPHLNFNVLVGPTFDKQFDDFEFPQPLEIQTPLAVRDVRLLVMQVVCSAVRVRARIVIEGCIYSHHQTVFSGSFGKVRLDGNSQTDMLLGRKAGAVPAAENSAISHKSLI